VVDVAIDRDAATDAGDGDGDLGGEQAIEAKVARDDADHAADGRDHREDLGGMIADERKACKAPDAAKEREGGGAVGGPDLPVRGGLDVGGANIGARE
jgi:hypothetical protein